MMAFHIFSDNLVNVTKIAKELKINKFSYSITVYRHKDEKLIKFTITTNNSNTLEDLSILEEIRLDFGL